MSLSRAYLESPLKQNQSYIFGSSLSAESQIFLSKILWFYRCIIINENFIPEELVHTLQK